MDNGSQMEGALWFLSCLNDPPDADELAFASYTEIVQAGLSWV